MMLVRLFIIFLLLPVSNFIVGHSVGVYYSDFPGALIMRHLREPKYWPYIKQLQQFYSM